MNVVFVSPNFPPTYFNFCRQLREAGANVLCIGDAPYEGLMPELQASMTEYHRVGTMLDYDAMLRACGYFTHKYGKIDRIESHTEFWLAVDAQLREDFNVAGQSLADLEVNRHKMGMKRRFIEAGVPCAEGILARDPDAVRQFAAEHAYPLIFKPDQGVGASGTFKVFDDGHLESVLKALPAGCMIETILEGDLLSFDGLTDRHGDIVFWTAHLFSSGIMEIVSERRPMHYYSLREIPPKLEELGRKAVSAFGVRERFFHIEFFQQDHSTYFALEINVRPPGGFTMDMMNYACDINLFRWWAEIVVNDRKDFHFERKYHVAHASRRNGLPYQLTHDELLAKLGPLVVDHREVPAALSDAMGDYTYFLRSPEQDELLEGISLVEVIH